MSCNYTCKYERNSLKYAYLCWLRIFADIRSYLFGLTVFDLFSHKVKFLAIHNFFIFGLLEAAFCTSTLDINQIWNKPLAIIKIQFWQTLCFDFRYLTNFARELCWECYLNDSCGLIINDCDPSGALLAPHFVMSTSFSVEFHQ